MMDYERLLEENQRERERQAREAYELSDFGVIVPPVDQTPIYEEQF